MQQNILLHTGPGHAWKLFSAWFSVLPTMKSFRIFRAIFSDSFEDFLKVFLRKTFRKSFKTILEYFPKYSQRNHCRTTENHADNQFNQAGFRSLCNKIPFIIFERYIPKQFVQSTKFLSESIHGLRAASKNRSKTYGPPCIRMGNTFIILSSWVMFPSKRARKGPKGAIRFQGRRKK